MGLRVRLHRRARADLIEIRTYLLGQLASSAAERIRSHLQERITRLGAVPLLGISSTHPDIRILPPTKYPYRIYYTLTDTTVVILHIRHTSRRLPDIDDLV